MHFRKAYVTKYITCGRNNPSIGFIEVENWVKGFISKGKKLIKFEFLKFFFSIFFTIQLKNIEKSKKSKKKLSATARLTGALAGRLFEMTRRAECSHSTRRVIRCREKFEKSSLPHIGTPKDLNWKINAVSSVQI